MVQLSQVYRLHPQLANRIASLAAPSNWLRVTLRIIESKLRRLLALIHKETL